MSSLEAPATLTVVAKRRPSRWLLAALAGWVVFGTWALFRPSVERVMGLDPVTGHVVVFYFVSLASFALLVRWLGTVRGLTLGLIGGIALSALSEWLQPILTDSRQAQLADLAGDALGVVAALVTTAVVQVALRSDVRRDQIVAAWCMVGLLISGGTIAADSDVVLAWRECRGGVGYETIADAPGRPVIRVDRSEVRVGNGPARPVGDGLVADDSAALRCAVFPDGAYSIVATVTPATLDMGGTTPKRIFTSSVGTDFDEYNTHIGQDADALSVRIRSGSGRQWESVPAVFEAGREVTVALVVDDGRATVFVDGEQRAEFELEGSSLSAWDPTYPILIGDEFTRNRTFQGEIASVSFFDRALGSDEPALFGAA